MEMYQYIISAYILIGIIVGVAMAIGDMDNGEPAEELMWIPLGLVAWPIFVAVFSMLLMRSKRRSPRV